jgi:hypothetical protein
MSDVLTRHHFDPVERTHTWERLQDVEPILDWTKEQQSESQGFAPTFHFIGQIPNIIIEKWLNEDGIEYRELMSGDGLERIVKRKLRDPDYAWLRTTSKRF